MRIEAPPTLAHRLALRLHNLWRYRVWSSCEHRWMLTLDAQGYPMWHCEKCQAKQL